MNIENWSRPYLSGTPLHTSILRSLIWETFLSFIFGPEWCFKDGRDFSEERDSRTLSCFHVMIQQNSFSALIFLLERSLLRRTKQQRPGSSLCTWRFTPTDELKLWKWYGKPALEGKQAACRYPFQIGRGLNLALSQRAETYALTKIDYENEDKLLTPDLFKVLLKRS